MKKLFIFAFAALGMLACSDINGPGNSGVKNGTLPGKFTINPRGDKIQFSQGNLQYQASTDTWRFGVNQWDAICASIKNGEYDGWIDLFRWGTGDDPTKSSKYEDWSIFSDWGVNKISNGGNITNAWRTLTNDEWVYLIDNRPSAEDLCGTGTVEGIHGLIIVPEDWKTPSGLKWQGMPNDWTTNKYAAVEWKKMEKAGAVFLPAASKNEEGYYGDRGYYWSATPTEDANSAYSFNFQPLWLCTSAGGYYRYEALSVRLVKDVK